MKNDKAKDVGLTEYENCMIIEGLSEVIHRLLDVPDNEVEKEVLADYRELRKKLVRTFEMSCEFKQD